MKGTRLRGLLWLALMAGILYLAAFGLFLGRTEATSTWQPTWSSVAQDWQPIGARCWTIQGNQLVMRCQSAGIVSHRTWSPLFAIDARVSVSATAVNGGHYFAGLTVYDAQSGDTIYGELALSRLVPPFNIYTSTDSAGAMVDEWLMHYEPIVPGQTYTLEVTWQPGGAYLFSLNGQPFATEWPLVMPAHDLSIFLLCASVGEATPDDGSLAECRFSNLSVTGVEVSDVHRLWLPSAGGSGPVY